MSLDGLKKCTNISLDNLKGRDNMCVDERIMMMMIIIIIIIIINAIII